MAGINDGTITPGVSASNGYFGDAWRMSGGVGQNYMITNDVNYAGYLVGDNTQALRQQKQGWRKVSQNISDNLSGAFRHALAAVNEWLQGGGK